jgi:hypothetical protein
MINPEAARICATSLALRDETREQLCFLSLENMRRAPNHERPAHELE